MNYNTPIVSCYGMSDDNDIFIKRDDLLPFSFGGNKVRIAEEFFDDMIAKGKNCMVGYGNARSNLCRVLANMSYAKFGGGYCHIISPLDDDGVRVNTYNSLIVSGCNAVIHVCNKQNVANTVEAVMNECQQEGLYPYYIYGDKTGNGNKAVPVRAYVKVYEEIKNKYDYIFLATGTGMTQAGLIAGKQHFNGKEEIIGISVARKAEQEKNVLLKYLNSYFYSIGRKEKIDNINVVDDYIGEGYGKFTAEIMDVIRAVMINNGIALDPTYTGKAFYGMLDYLKKNKIKNKRVLFIHTGGIPLFFDNANIIFKQPIYQSELNLFLSQIDSELPTPLSKRVDLADYGRKIYEKAHLCVKKVNGNVKALVAGYTENIDNNLSYITLVGTLPDARGNGYATELVKQFIQYCKDNKIGGVHLHTEKSNTIALALYCRLGFVPYIIDNEPRPDDCHLIYWIKENI